MAKRQFTKTDTSRWREKYTNGAAGNKVYTSTHTLDSTDGFYNSRINSGVAGGFTANVPDLADGTYNLPCKIVQTQGVNANADPNWEFNKLISVTGGVATFKYEFTRDFSNGAQVITGNPYKTVTINPGILVTVPAWDGGKGGEFVQFASISWDNSHGSLVNMVGLGFRGGTAVGEPGGHGEGHSGIGTNSVSANTNGGGGGHRDINNSPWFASAPGGGGGNATAGNNGSWVGGANLSTPGTGGLEAGNSALTTMQMGGGGGKGGRNDSNNGGVPGPGGGNVTIVSPDIRCGNMSLNGIEGGGSAGNEGAGGSGAAGSGLFKCEKIDLGSLAALGGPAHLGATYSLGGKGSDGRLHVDIVKATKVIGASSPMPTITEDSTMNTNKAGASLLMNLR